MSYFIKNGDLSYAEFVEAIKRINAATSITGIAYTGIQVVNDNVVGIRESTNAPFRISLKSLYDAYRHVLVFTTTELKPYVNRVQSPSLAILIAINAIKRVEGRETDLTAAYNHKNIASKDNYGKRKSWLTKFTITFVIVGILIFWGKQSESTVANGKLTSAAHVEAVTAIKSRLSNPSSYEGSGVWEDAVWDSGSQTKRYVLRHSFTYRNMSGERVHSMAFIYFDVNGKPTYIEFMDY